MVKGKTFTYPSGYVIALRLWRMPRIYRGKDEADQSILKYVKAESSSHPLVSNVDELLCVMVLNNCIDLT